MPNGTVDRRLELRLRAHDLAYRRGGVGCREVHVGYCVRSYLETGRMERAEVIPGHPLGSHAVRRIPRCGPGRSDESGRYKEAGGKSTSGEFGRRDGPVVQVSVIEGDDQVT